ncbi:MAG: hypothetical protein ACYDG6_04780 [Thermincolia bacterium]
MALFSVLLPDYYAAYVFFSALGLAVLWPTIYSWFSYRRLR